METHWMHEQMKPAFTLIELLVVVTIIVVLLALLVPAMDKAIYEAELIQCSAQIRGMTSAVLTYAAENQRSYPRPPLGRANGHSAENLGQRSTPDRFVMGMMEPYFTKYAFQCPLLGGMSYEEVDNLPETFFYGNYYIWFGTRYTDVAGNQGMYKIGDRFEHRMAVGEPVRKFRTLISDMNTVNREPGDAIDMAISAHPDRDDILVRRVWQNVFQLPWANYSTFSRWTGGGGGGPIRGHVDLSFAFDDASVERFDDLELHDSRMTQIPHHTTRGNDWWAMIPRN